MTENLLLDHISPTRTSSSSVVGESLEEICLNNGINPSKIKQKGKEVTDLELFFNGFSNLSTLRNIFTTLHQFSSVTSMLVTDVKGQMCW